MALSTVDREISTRREAAPDSYLAYLNSSSWRMTRNRALRLAGYTCHRCHGKRDLQVHHKTYERLGAERDSDLEVLCQTCHNHHHREEAPRGDDSGTYRLLVSQVVKATPMASYADISDDVKHLCLKSGIPIDIPRIDRAISLVCSTRLKDGQRPYVSPVEDKSTPVEAMSHAQTVEILARIRERLGVPVIQAKGMAPPERQMTPFQRDRAKAYEMVIAELAETAARCDELERAVQHEQ
jgi:hypothetical protein